MLSLQISVVIGKVRRKEAVTRYTGSY